MSRRIRDVSGQRFTRLVVKSFSHQVNGRGPAYWLCVCDCGKEKVIASAELIKGSTKSCGCYGREMHRQKVCKPYGHASFMSLFGHYRTQAARRGYEFILSIDEFRTITKSDCFYCGKSPCGKKLGRGFNGDYVYNGVDRVDNTKGYISSNCVPCCKHCNTMKMSMNQMEFLAHVYSIVNHQGLLTLVADGARAVAVREMLQ